MAINKKGSRKIMVSDHEFRWRASGNDGWITVVIWPIENESCRVLGKSGYHHDWVDVGDGCSISASQALITNRIIRETILYVGVEKMLSVSQQINVGSLESIFDFENAVRSEKTHNNTLENNDAKNARIN